MDIKRITAAYFSPTGNVEKVVRCLTERIHNCLGGSPELVFFDFLPPESRELSGLEFGEFGEGDLLIIGVPVYAGRVPNRILPFIQNGFNAAERAAGQTSTGQTAAGQVSPICIPIVCFGNRSFDDGLAELAMEMRNSGFIVPAGAAVSTEHSFCQEIGIGRPDEKDMEEIKEFADKVGKSLALFQRSSEISFSDVAPVMPGNTPPGPYYTPLKEDGTPANFLKTAFPVTDIEKCDRCMKCANRCPMSSIDKIDPAEITGICIKCQACVHCCPQGAKSFTDESFISHKQALAANYQKRADNVFVL